MPQPHVILFRIWRGTRWCTYVSFRYCWKPFRYRLVRFKNPGFARNWPFDIVNGPNIDPKSSIAIIAKDHPLFSFTELYDTEDAVIPSPALAKGAKSGKRARVNYCNRISKWNYPTAYDKAIMMNLNKRVIYLYQFRYIIAVILSPSTSPSPLLASARPQYLLNQVSSKDRNTSQHELNRVINGNFCFDKILEWDPKYLSIKNVFVLSATTIGKLIWAEPQELSQV